MREEDPNKTEMADMLGFAGLALAIAGFSDIDVESRLICLLGSGICLPISFKNQLNWPLWIRWLLSVATDLFLAFAAWSAILKS